MTDPIKTITLTTEQMFAIEQALELRIAQCRAAVKPDADPYWREQLEIAEQLLRLVEET